MLIPLLVRFEVLTEIIRKKAGRCSSCESFEIPLGPGHSSAPDETALHLVI